MSIHDQVKADALSSNDPFEHYMNDPRLVACQTSICYSANTAAHENGQQPSESEMSLWL
jgi:hypothetical protein